MPVDAQRMRMLAELLRAKQPVTNALHKPTAFANALNKPLPMEGRFGLLPLKDRNTLMGDERRDWALPGLLAGAWNAFTAPGRAMDGQAGFDPKTEAANFAGTFTGGGLLGSRMAPVPRGSIGMNAYHGSPHKFDAFDSSKIGTGEGAQAYGHGLYFAESKAVAGQYQANLSPQFQELVRYAGPDRVKTAAGMAASGVAESTAKDGLRALGVADVDAVWNAGRRMAESAKGSLYHVDVPDEAISKMLDWDKPLSQQSKEIQDLARRVGIGSSMGPTRGRLNAFLSGTESAERGTVATGQDLYRAIANYGSNSVEGSKALAAAGIPGIRYLDNGSRGVGQGTRNFVLFDDKLARITKRE